MNQYYPQGMYAPPAGGGYYPPYRKKKSKLLLWIVLAVLTVCIAGTVSLGLVVHMLSSRAWNAEGAAAVLQRRTEELGYSNALSELTEEYTAKIGEHNYYRLQQNYQGIPVWGRSVVYVTDRWGQCLCATQNVEDVSQDLDLTPSVTVGQVREAVGVYIQQVYPELGSEPAADISLDRLYIYVEDDSASRLAYEIDTMGLHFLVDAHTAEVLSCRESTSGLFGGGDGFGDPERTTEPNVEQWIDEYLRKAEERGIYLFSANDQIYYSPKKRHYHYRNLSVVNLEAGTVAGIALDDRFDYVAKTLKVVCDIQDYYTDELSAPELGSMLLVLDDMLDGETGFQAAGGWGKKELFCGDIKLSEKRIYRDDTEIGMLTLGKGYVNAPDLYADVLAHEYTHIISRKYVRWSGKNPETAALDEAISDIMGQLISDACRPPEQGQEEWEVAMRPIEDPGSKNYPVYAGQYGDHKNFQVLMSTTGATKEVDYAHFYSTVISHAAYRMSKGEGGEKIPAHTLAELWYRTILMLPSDADFADCRAVVTFAAELMELSNGQMECIEAAFDNAGIGEETEEDAITFLADKTFSLHVLGADGELCGGYQITVTKQRGRLALNLGEAESFTADMDHAEPCALELKKGLYEVLVKEQGSREEPIRIYIRVKAGEADDLYLPTSFGKQDAAETQNTTEQPTEAVCSPCLEDMGWDNAPLTVNDDGTAVMKLGPKAEDVIDSVGFSLYYVDPMTDWTIHLGTDDDMICQWEEGVFYDNFRGVWGAIDGYHVHMDLAAQDEHRNLYCVPVLLNGEEYYLQVIYDFRWESWEIQGAAGTVDDYGVAIGELRQLEAGDVLTILYMATILGTDQEFQFYPGEEITVTEDIFFGEEPLGDGEYWLTFEMWDAAGHYACSEFVIFTCIGDEIYAESLGE